MPRLRAVLLLLLLVGASHASAQISGPRNPIGTPRAPFSQDQSGTITFNFSAILPSGLRAGGAIDTYISQLGQQQRSNINTFYYLCANGTSLLGCDATTIGLRDQAVDGGGHGDATIGYYQATCEIDGCIVWNPPNYNSVDALYLKATAVSGNTVTVVDWASGLALGNLSSLVATGDILADNGALSPAGLPNFTAAVTSVSGSVITLNQATSPIAVGDQIVISEGASNSPRIIGGEDDLSCLGSNCRVSWMTLLGSSYYQPTAANGIQFGSLSTQAPGVAQWIYPLVVTDGAVTGSGAAINVGAQFPAFTNIVASSAATNTITFGSPSTNLIGLSNFIGKGGSYIAFDVTTPARIPTNTTVTAVNLTTGTVTLSASTTVAAGDNIDFLPTGGASGNSIPNNYNYWSTASQEGTTATYANTQGQFVASNGFALPTNASLSNTQALDGTGLAIAVPNTSNAALPVMSGLVAVTNQNTDDTGLYLLGGNAAALVSSTLGSWVAPTTTPASGKASVAYDGSSGHYRIYNNTGSQVIVSGLNLATRDNN